MGEHTENFREKLLKIEAKSGIFELKVNGLRLWQYVRWYCLMRILYDVTGEGKVQIHQKISQEKLNMNFKEWIERQQFLLGKKDMVVLNHPRRVKEGKYYRCFVTETLLENLDCSYYVFEKAFRGQHFRPAPTKNLKYIHMDNIQKVFKVSNSDTDKQLKLFCNKVIQIFEKDNQIVLSKNVKKEIFDGITKGYYQIYWWTIWAKIVFALVKPKVLITTSPYMPDVEAVIVEAKRQHITTIEMQHGIAKGHLFYNYLYQGRIDIFSDYMFAYSKHDREMQRYPIKKERIIPVGYPDLERRVKECQREKTCRQKTILFISPVSSDAAVIEYAIKLRQDTRLADMRIIYKLHPHEYGIWEKISQYHQLANSGIEIISENKHDIYFYLGQADYVVGNVSTALYEATEFDAEIFIICCGNYKGSEVLYEGGYAQLVTSVEMLADEILNPVSHNKKSYFEKNAIVNMKRELSRIMSESDERRKM